MESQEAFDPNIWYVLKKIKRNHIQSETDILTRYDIHLLLNNDNTLSSQDEFEVLKKLVEWNVIRISHKKLRHQLRVSVYLDTIQPIFDEIYEKYKLQQPVLILDNPFLSDTRQEALALNYEKQIIHQDFKREETFFSKYYIQREIRFFEITLKHCLEIGEVNHESFTLLSAHIKILRKLLDSDAPVKKKRKTKRQKPVLVSQQQPLPITGEIIVTGLNESLKALKLKSPENTGPKFPHKVPAGTHWHDVIIKFLDNERVEIYVKRLKHITDFKGIGMIGKGKEPAPSEPWFFLKVLAKCFGELSFKDSEAKEKYKKQKQTLTESLQNYFSIDYDPFYPYYSSPEKHGNSYKIKLMLLPAPETNSSNIPTNNEDTDPFGIQEYLNETAPQVPDY